MTPKDSQLIEKALRMNHTEHHQVDALAHQAVSQEAKERLHLISRKFYHMEEYHAGVL